MSKILAATFIFPQYIGWLVALDKAGSVFLLDLPCTDEWHSFSIPSKMYTSLSADIVEQCSMHVLPSLAMFVTCVNF